MELPAISASPAAAEAEPEARTEAQPEAEPEDDVHDQTVPVARPLPARRPPEPAEAPPAPPPVTPSATPAPEAPPAPEAAPKPEVSAAAAAPAQAAPGRAPATLLTRVHRWLPVVLMVEGVIMYFLAMTLDPGPLRGVRPVDIDGLGLISAMPLSAFAGILIMIVSFFVTVTQAVDRKILLLVQISAITLALHGAGSLVADEPRFPTAYVHAGFVEFIARTGEAATSIDARMGWPGFFALFAFVTRTAGVTDLTTILQWTPPVMNLLYLLPLVLILRQVVATTRARWYAALLFVIVQWIGQDYFSPQGFTFALYLAFVAIVLRWFGRVEPRVKPLPRKGLRRLLAKLDAMTPGELANPGVHGADRVLLLCLLIALFVAATASHQITPFMMLGVVTALLLVRRTSLSWALPFFLGLIVLAWISFQAVGFWAGNIESMFGSLGQIFTNLQRNTGDRIAGTDPEHALVLKARLGICAAVLGLAGVGLLRRLRRGVVDRAALVLLCVPVMALGLQSYGGEIGLRIYMFTLPGACLLASYAFFPNLPGASGDARDETIPMRKRRVRLNPQVTRKVSLALALCAAMAFSMAFLVARYGNEKFERVTTGEIQAMHYIYEHDRPSARVLYLVPNLGPESTPILPWGERDVDRIEYRKALVHKDPTQIKDALDALRLSERNTYLVVTTAQADYLKLNEDFPADWGRRFRTALDASPDLRKVVDNRDAAVYVWKNVPKSTPIPDPAAYTGRDDPGSPWTPVGAVALAVTWAALFAYEVLSLRGRERGGRGRRRLLFVAVPAFLLSMAVIVERFLVIAGS
ncbi:hypothetical protein [Thermoactinospora rubra]|uniref:hypothetical protein n=1 Tax=Thermoactinospora rubra TaxID=1088767 RepID=UPI001180EAF5|nr:hypothetical protein [Thermoactinospora rubra]